MDLKSLSTFIQVAELNSFSRAADKLGYAQPTVSFQIKQLESELSVQLFDRIGHTICLTDDGRNLLAYAQQICHLADEMIAGKATDAEPTGNIHIAMADSLCAPMMLEKFAKFHEMFPSISVKITTAGTDKMFDLLDHNEIDIVCTLDSHIYNTSYLICSEEKIGVHIVCSSQNPLALCENIEISELLNEPFILTEKGMSYRRLLDELFAKMSLELNPILELGSADIICKLVEENAGISFLPDYVTENAVKNGKVVRLNVSGAQVDLWKQILYHRDKWVTAPMKSVLDYISNITIN
ncbi:MAG: LysR family transcriptional regulator [Clostridia bacterium]|nr:LysR family transcriptional regulator [Clostridia bacterium]